MDMVSTADAASTGGFQLVDRASAFRSSTTTNDNDRKGGPTGCIGLAAARIVLSFPTEA
jgi:hypothetical protein